MIEKLFVAKSGKTSSEWLPLLMHLKDTAEIMEYLLENFISDSFCISCNMKEEDIKRTAIFLAYVHDIGKATVAFQYKISHNVSDRIQVLEHYGLKLPDKIENIQDTPHALAGEVILRYFKCPKGIAAIVGAHHGVPAESGNIVDQDLNQRERDIKGYTNYFGSRNNKEMLESAWNKIIDIALENSHIDSLEELQDPSPHAQMLLTGLLIMADWIASSTDYFPLIDTDETGSEEYYPDRARQAKERINFPVMWKSFAAEYNDILFNQNFGFNPNETQRSILEISMSTKNPGLFIIEAPMGCGKTEAAISTSQIMAAKLLKNGLFFGLPTQATANGIFPRIKSWAEKQSEESFHSIQLKHGNSALNKVFQEIQKGITEESDSGLIVHSWFCGNKKACLDNFVVATVDQILMSALKRRHVMLLHLGLSEKVIIVDEVHAYDAYMNQYLERALQWLGKYQTPVILLSATLPAKRRMSLVKAYLQNENFDKKFEENISYPLLTWTDGNNISQKPLPYTGKHKSVNIKKCRTDDIISVVRDVVKCGGCVGIIMNTVKRAQKISDDIRNNVTENLLLYHAQYIMPDRARKEEELLKYIGKNSNQKSRNGRVIVGTQVLEQSLDIDFDLLITDICPMDLLLQRIGRLQRHERNYRPDIVKDPVCYVVTDEFEEKKTGSKMIYGEWLLKETIYYLPENIILPDNISTLVQLVYSTCDNSDEFKKYKSDLEISKRRAEAFLLDKPDNSADNTIHNLIVKGVNCTDDSKAEASVRDGISSVEVLVMQINDDKSVKYFLDGTAVSDFPTDKEYERIANQKLRLPSVFCQNYNIDSTIAELENKCYPYIANWQESYWLQGQLVLFLDENMEAELADYRLKYSYENGLQIEKEYDKDG